MHPKVIESFWSDPGFDVFEGVDLACARTTFLWTFTSPTTSELGVFPVSSKLFRMDTGLEPAWIERIIAAFPNSFHRDGSTRIWVRNYIRYQYGTGASLALNNMAKTLRKKIAQQSPELRAEILRVYPELKPFGSPSQGLGKPFSGNDGLKPFGSPSEALAQSFPNQSPQGVDGAAPSGPNAQNESHGGSPSEGLGKPSATATATATANSKEGVQGEGAEIPSLAEVKTYAATIGMTEESAVRFWNYYEGLDWIKNGAQIRKWRHFANIWRTEDEARRSSQKGRSGRPESSRPVDREEIDELRAALQTERDPVRREELRKQLEAMTA